MGKTWVLDTETKGTGANMVPIEKVHGKAAASDTRPEPRRARSAKPRRADSAEASRARSAKRPAARSATALPPGHVRKKATGEIGKIQSVDARAGTATVHWLKRGAASTVPLTAISRR